MTETALQALVKAKVGEALAKVKATGAPGGISMKLNEHFRKSAEHEKNLGKNHKLLADAHGLLARACESHMDVAGQKCHKIASEVNTAIAHAHEKHAKHLSEMAAESLDGGEKVAKSATENFFDTFVYGAPPLATSKRTSLDDLL